MRLRWFGVAFWGASAFLYSISSSRIGAQATAPIKAPESVDSVTVPFALDQGRIVIDVDIQLPNGGTERVRGWLDNGAPEMKITRRVAALMGLGVSCDSQSAPSSVPQCSAVVPRDLTPVFVIRGMRIPLTGVREMKLAPGDALAPGMSAEVNVPATFLRNYDMLVNFPEREITIGVPGRVKFNGVKSKMEVSADGLVTVAGKVETIETKNGKRKTGNRDYEIALDLGSTMNYLSDGLFAGLAAAHADWPQVRGAIGPFNAGERNDEPNWKLMRIDRVEFGPLVLTKVAVANFARKAGDRPSLAANAALSAEALMNYRVGLDYAHATVYFDIARTTEIPDFDVVGLILRPVGDTGFATEGVADFEGRASVEGVEIGDQLLAIDGTPVAPLTPGQVWALLEGAPGKERRLTMARAGKQFEVVAKTKHFL
jgi:hypothetical protein